MVLGGLCSYFFCDHHRIYTVRRSASAKFEASTETRNAAERADGLEEKNYISTMIFIDMTDTSPKVTDRESQRLRGRRSSGWCLWAGSPHGSIVDLSGLTHAETNSRRPQM